MEVPGKELVERSRRRDAEAFAALIRMYERVALSVAFGLLKDASSAGDVVQEAFIRAWERLDDLREPDRFGTWLCGIVRNLSLDVLRRRKPNEPWGADQNAADQRWTHDPLEELNLKERNATIASAIASLDEVSRPVIVLRYFEGLSSKQIGELLEMSPAAVDMRLSRARKQLRTFLGEFFAEEGMKVTKECEA
jgi:RNA polymerase sigma-70 factor (ECF subfamily)